MRPSLVPLAALATVFLLAACGEDQAVEAPQPQEVTRAAIGYYCNMIVEDHPGPKGQIFLAGTSDPIWFSSVRDTIAFTLLPEEAKSISAIYVNDMGHATWDKPEPGTWIAAEGAWYVIGSTRRGGMGAPEPVPFSDRAAADAFAVRHGGRVAAFTEIPEHAILGEIAESEQAAGHGHGDSDMLHGEHAGKDAHHGTGAQP